MDCERRLFDWPKAIAWLLMLAVATALWSLVGVAVQHTFVHG